MFSIVHCATFSASAKLSGIAIVEENQRVDGLRAALDIERKRLVIVVAWRSILEEERLLPVLVTASSCSRRSCSSPVPSR